MRETISEPEVSAVVKHLDLDVEAMGSIAVSEFITSGNIHPVTVKIATESSAIALQRINEAVFRSPEQVASNIQAVSAHLRVSNRNGTAALELVRWKDGGLVHRNHHGCWRATRFWDNIEVHTRPPSHEHAHQAGRALGLFHERLRDFQGDLPEVIEGYHLVSFYHDQLNEQVERMSKCGTPFQINEIMGFILSHADEVRDFEWHVSRGFMPVRVVHRDSKLQNVAFCAGTPNVHGLLDWDTIGRDVVHLDLGDLLRSCCNPAGFRPERIEDIAFDVQMYKAVMTGYLDTASGFLTDLERAFLSRSAHLVLFQLVIRYTTDFLDGGRTFGLDPEDPARSLRKARIYAQLLKSAQLQQDALDDLV